VTSYAPVDGPHFEAKLYVVNNAPHDAGWAGFVRDGFGQDVQLPPASSPAALIVVAAADDGDPQYFGLPFGIGGRHLLRLETIARGYGLRAALNMIYAAQADDDDADRVRAVDAKRRGPTIVRSRSQASEASAFEVFGVDQLRDVVNAATGVPRDSDTWGRRVSGSDALTLDVPVGFDDLGELCLLVEDAYSDNAYAASFGWIDDIRPVADPVLRDQLEEMVIEALVESDGVGLELAPPEVIDWELVSSFHYHFDRRPRHGAPITHPDLRLQDYLGGLKRAGQLDQLSMSNLRGKRIEAVDGSGLAIYSWSVWRCLVGELRVDGEVFILDEGEFFTVQDDFIQDLDAFLDGRLAAFTGLPTSPAQQHEPDYNRAVATSSADYVLLDAKSVTVTGRTTPIEICDLLSKSKELIHVKRHLGSSDLSHLFSQGYVSAELLHSDGLFREKAHEKIASQAAGTPGFDFFDTSAIHPSDFNVVYAVIADWHGRSVSEALPFFSKVNLRHFVENLYRMDFRVSFARVQTTT